MNDIEFQWYRELARILTDAGNAITDIKLCTAKDSKLISKNLSYIFISEFYTFNIALDWLEIFLHKLSLISNYFLVKSWIKRKVCNELKSW